MPAPFTTPIKAHSKGGPCQERHGQTRPPARGIAPGSSGLRTPDVGAQGRPRQGLGVRGAHSAGSCKAWAQGPLRLRPALDLPLPGASTPSTSSRRPQRLTRRSAASENSTPSARHSATWRKTSSGLARDPT